MRVTPYLTHGLLAASQLLKGSSSTSPSSGKMISPDPDSKQDQSRLGSFFANLGRGSFENHIRTQSVAPVVDGVLSSQTNRQPAGRAAGIFQAKFQQATLNTPGSVFVSRKDLNLKENQLVMIDVGGEGQKTDLASGLKSGSAHAINVNAQETVSSTPINIALEPGGDLEKIDSGKIPNLIRPIANWPAPNHKGKLFPLEDGFSNLTLMEGAPVFDYHVEELARVTDKKGWMVLTVSDVFEKQIEKLAAAHNGGTVWKTPPENEDEGFPRYILPPGDKAKRPDVQAAFEEVSSHELFDTVQKLQSSNKPADAHHDRSDL